MLLSIEWKVKLKTGGSSSAIFLTYNRNYAYIMIITFVPVQLREEMMSMMRNVKHVNLADQEGRVYCCLRNRVVKLDDEQKERFCKGCIMYSGDAQGLGVECVWEDIRPVADPHVATEPYVEWKSNQAKGISMDHLATLMIYGW
jgi:hypothetical protein